MYPIDSFQDHLPQFYHFVPKWLLSRPYDLILVHCVPNWLLSRPHYLVFALCSHLPPILSLCTLLTPFKTVWPNFIIVYPIDSYQDHLTLFYYSGPNWLLSRPFAPILSFCVSNWLIPRPFNLIFSLCTQLTLFKTILPGIIIVYPINSFQVHFDLMWSLCTQLTPFKTIWTNFIIVYPFGSFQNWFHLSCDHCVLNWLLSRPFDLIFVNVYPVDSYQDHLTQFYYCVPYWLLSRPFDLILCIVDPIDSFQDHLPQCFIEYIVYAN